MWAMKTATSDGVTGLRICQLGTSWSQRLPIANPEPIESRQFLGSGPILIGGQHRCRGLSQPRIISVGIGTNWQNHRSGAAQAARYSLRNSACQPRRLAPCRDNTIAIELPPAA